MSTASSQSGEQSFHSQYTEPVRSDASVTRPQTAGGAVYLNDVQVSFGNVPAVENTTLTVPSGNFVCLLGPSGCGKSTLLNLIAGFIRPTEGTAYVDKQEILSPGPDRGMVFQHHSLLPWKRVKDNVAFGPRMAGHGKAQAESTARTFLALVGLDKYADAWPSELSGGMKQRVGIARALANYPNVLLMDEPFGALDAQTRSILQSVTLDIWHQFQRTVVFVTHDVDEALFMADKIFIMSSGPGRIIEELDVELPRPRTEQVVTSPPFVEKKRHCLEIIRQETLKTFGGGSQ